MIYTAQPGARTGTVMPPVSKSIAHRKLICAALSGPQCSVDCGPAEELSADITATKACLSALLSGGKVLPCGESGSTLRFLLPVAAALGADVSFHMEGLLPNRPHKELTDQLALHGAVIRQEGSEMFCNGQITAGEYTIPGGVSSQFVSGLLFAIPLLKGDSTITIEGRLESAAYVAMTEQAVTEAGIRVIRKDNGFFIPGGQKYRAKAEESVERDWSGAAFGLCLGGFSEKGITVSGLRPDSLQGDRRILDILAGFGAEIKKEKDGILVKRGAEMKPQTIDASEIPDLVPVISVFAAGIKGETRITHAERLRFKESDRLATTEALIRSLGGTAEQTEDGLRITGRGFLTGGTVNPAKDHRIAMSAAVAAAICSEPVVILDAECAGKSYPGFYKDFERLEVTG